MATKLKEPVEKTCEECGSTFKTKYPNRQRFCPGSRCRSEAWNKKHRVSSVEDVGRAALRSYWRTTRAAQRARKREREQQGVL